MPLMPTQWGKWEWEMTSPGKTTVGQNGARFAESWRCALVNANPKSMKLQQCGRMCIRVSSLQYGTASHTSSRMCNRELPGNGFFITHGMMGEKYLAADGIGWIRSRACAHWGGIPGLGRYTLGSATATVPRWHTGYQCGGLRDVIVQSSCDFHLGKKPGRNV